MLKTVTYQKLIFRHTSKRECYIPASVAINFNLQLTPASQMRCPNINFNHNNILHGMENSFHPGFSRFIIYHKIGDGH
jgi:hypothetical protein